MSLVEVKLQDKPTGPWFVCQVTVDGRYTHDAAVHSSDPAAGVWFGIRNTSWEDVVPNVGMTEVFLRLEDDSVHRVDIQAKMTAQFVDQQWVLTPDAADLAQKIDQSASVLSAAL